MFKPTSNLDKTVYVTPDVILGSIQAVIVSVLEYVPKNIIIISFLLPTCNSTYVNGCTSNNFLFTCECLA